MAKKISLDTVLKNLQEQAHAEWAVLENTENVIGGASGSPVPAQDGCHKPTQAE